MYQATRSFINPIASNKNIAAVLTAVKENQQKWLKELNVSYPLQQRMITSYLVWDNKSQSTVVVYRMMNKGHDWLRMNTH